MPFLKSTEPQAGFSLVELLLVIVLIAILSSISITQYSNFRVKSFDRTAESDLRNLEIPLNAAIGSEEAVEFVNCTNETCMTSYTGYNRSSGVFVSVTTTDGSDFVAVTCHQRGRLQYIYSSVAPVPISLPLSGACSLS